MQKRCGIVIGGQHIMMKQNLDDFNRGFKEQGGTLSTAIWFPGSCQWMRMPSALPGRSQLAAAADGKEAGHVFI
jgi:hypothetical protein